MVFISLTASVRKNISINTFESGSILIGFSFDTNLFLCFFPSLLNNNSNIHRNFPENSLFSHTQNFPVVAARFNTMENVKSNCFYFYFWGNFRISFTFSLKCLKLWMICVSFIHSLTPARTHSHTISFVLILIWLLLLQFYQFICRFYYFSFILSCKPAKQIVKMIIHNKTIGVYKTLNGNFGWCLHHDNSTITDSQHTANVKF